MGIIICILLTVSCAVPLMLCCSWIDRNFKRCGIVEILGMALFTCAWWIIAFVLMIRFAF